MISLVRVTTAAAVTLALSGCFGGVPLQPGDDHDAVLELLARRWAENDWVPLPGEYDHLSERGEVRVFQQAGTDLQGVVFVTGYQITDGYGGLIYTVDGREPTFDPLGHSSFEFERIKDHWFRISAT